MNGRNSDGSFAKGNPGGPGNPHGRRVARLRSLMLDAVTDDDLKEIVTSMVSQAKAGDAAATKLLLSYLVGKPVDAPDPDRLAVAETENEADRREAESRKWINKPNFIDTMDFD
jgi:hypothetical protein